MAYVPMSRGLIERALDRIKNMEKSELKVLGDKPKPYVDASSSFITNLVWGDNVHLRDLMPDDWCPTLEGHLSIKFKVGNTAEDAPYNYSAHLGINGTAKATPRHSYYGTSYAVSEDAIETKPIYDWAKQHYEIDTRWTKVRRQVQDFLESCKSLNEATKLWPEVQLYVDPEDMARLDVKKAARVPQESEAAKVLAQLNTDELVGAAVIARMSEAA